METPFFMKKASFSKKKIVQTFGGYKKNLYLCTRFRKGSEFLKKLVW